MFAFIISIFRPRSMPFGFPPPERQRRGIFVELHFITNFSPVGAAYSAPTELGWLVAFYKYSSPNGLGGGAIKHALPTHGVGVGAGVGVGVAGSA